MAGGAVTIEELILGLQGKLGSTPEAFHRAAEHLLRIAGALLSPLALHWQSPEEQALFIALSNVKNVSLMFKSPSMREYYQSGCFAALFACVCISLSGSICLVAQLSGPCLQAPMCGQLPVLEAIWRSCGSVRCSLIWRQCLLRLRRLSL